jgi:flagellar L-ring protein precursor FlgH
MDKHIVAVLLALLLPAGLSAQRSLYQDYKAGRIGDVVTIILQEDIRGATSTDASNISNRSGVAGAQVQGNMTPFLPSFGANSRFNYQGDDKMQAQQSQLLRGTISARVEDVTPSGDLLLFGERSMEINGELHKMSVRGYIRANDVDAFNSVPSFRIANAEIVYSKKGGLKQASKRPFFGRTVVWLVLVTGLGSAAAIGVFRNA